MALSLVMCGAGDLETLKLLRGCLDGQVTYGQHQTYAMCVGFLFLGGGKLTLGCSKLAVAALLIACYPRFPRHSLDNQFHLQMLRHFYVLAVERRHVTPIDVDSKLPLSVPLHIELTRDRKAPCLLPDLNEIRAIRIHSGADAAQRSTRPFWDVSLSALQTNAAGWHSIVRHGLIDLKRRSGCAADEQQQRAPTHHVRKQIEAMTTCCARTGTAIPEEAGVQLRRTKWATSMCTMRASCAARGAGGHRRFEGQFKH